MKRQVKLDGTTIKSPHFWTIERYKITEATRVATGDMKMDFKAKKRKFLLEYTSMSGSEYDQIMAILDTPKVFFNLEYTINGRWESAVVYVGAIRGREVRSHMGSVWADVTFNLIER